jgi:hypothetical protein
MTTGQVLLIAPAISEQPGERRNQCKEPSLDQAGWSGKPDHVVELAGEDDQLQKVWHPSSINLSILSEPKGVHNHQLKSRTRANFNANDRIFFPRRSTSRAERREGRAT